MGILNIFNKKELTPEEILQKGINFYKQKDYSSAVDVLLKIQDMAEAQYYIGSSYWFMGDKDSTLRKDYYEVAVQWLYLAAQQKNKMALYDYALFMLQVHKDIPGGMKALEIACQYKSGAACQKMGMILIEQNKPKEAERYFKMGAELGNEYCIYNYGVFLLESGRKKEAFPWFKKSAEAGVPEAMNNYANYLFDLGRNKEAKSYVKRAAEAGVPEAQYKMYFEHQYDIISSTALEWLQKSANKNHAPAIALLTLLKFKKDRNVVNAWNTLKPLIEKREKHSWTTMYVILDSVGDKQKLESIAHLLDLSSEVLNLLASAYWEISNIDKAINLYTKSALCGNTSAINKLISYYWYKEDGDQTIYWLEQGVKYKDLVSIYNYGVFYMSKLGQYYPKAKEEAIKWLILAYRLGYENASTALKLAVNDMKQDTVKGFLMNVGRKLTIIGVTAAILGEESAEDIGTWIDNYLIKKLGSIETTITDAERLICH